MPTKASRYNTPPCRCVLCTSWDRHADRDQRGRGAEPSLARWRLDVDHDHIGLSAMIGHNPLWGPNDDSLGPRFPAISRAYDPDCVVWRSRWRLNWASSCVRASIAAWPAPPSRHPPKCASCASSAPMRAAVYCARSDVACHMEMRVLGFSGISNVAIDTLDADEAANHEEVLAAGRTLCRG